MFFGSASYFILVSRTARKHLRPLFLTKRFGSYKGIYDLIGVVCTMIMCSYSMVPFVLKHWGESMALWGKLYFSVHIAYGLFYVAMEFGGVGKRLRGIVRGLKEAEDVSEGVVGEDEVKVGDRKKKE
jgi:hypothetical protein